jgi:hypothetical protein
MICQFSFSALCTIHIDAIQCCFRYIVMCDKVSDMLPAEECPFGIFLNTE